MSGGASGLGPLVFEPILKEKVWGHRRLASYGKPLPEGGALIGESWEIADLAQTSAGGGGGGEARSVVRAGPAAGTTITELVRRMGADLLGKARPHRWDDGDAFPLLVKLLDAGQHLSVQVHPSPAYAEHNPGAHLKTESWVVLEADKAELPGGAVVEPGVFNGFAGKHTPERVRAAAESGAIAPLLNRLEAVVGDCHTLPSGTCHALGAGVLVAEVQTPSDTTFRVYDWAREYGRAGRELHLDQSLECIGLEAGGRAGAAVEPRRLDGGASRGVLARTKHYSIESVRLFEGSTLDLRDVTWGAFDAQRCAVVMVCRGSAQAESRSGAWRMTPLAMGTTALIAASDVADTVVASDGGAWVLVVRPG
ncbi:MAG: type I phosphomannose isomerase catalytic subunit [Planctomycetota bacterium]